MSNRDYDNDYDRGNAYDRGSAYDRGNAYDYDRGEYSPYAYNAKPQTVVTMNTDPHNSAMVTELQLDIGHFKTLPGILKLFQLLLGLLCMIFSAPARGLRGSGYGIFHNHVFLFVSVVAFIVTMLWAFFYFLRVKEATRHTQMPFTWTKLELVYTGLTALFYALASFLLLIGFAWCLPSGWCVVRVVAAVIGFVNVLAYALGAYLLHRSQRDVPLELQ